MTDRLPLALSTLGAGLCLAGCVQADGFPSLAQRPAERDLSIEEPVRPPVEVPSDSALRSRVAVLRQQALEGDRAFDAAYGAAAAAVGAAGAPESESWVAAQEALSRLEAARAGTVSAVRELDRLAIDRAAVATNEEDFAAIGAALEAVEAIADAQRARLDSLRRRLPNP